MSAPAAPSAPSHPPVLPMVEVEHAGPMRPPGSRLPVGGSTHPPAPVAAPRPRRSAAAAAAAAAAEAGCGARLDHICVAVSDVSEVADFLTTSGGRACEGFLTPVYLSATWEFANTAELQVIAPVESFQVKKAGLSAAERPTATKAFWEGNNSTTAPPAAPTAAAAAAASPNAVAAPPSASGAAPPTPLYSSPSSPRPRTTFLQRYLRRHGPSIHHVAFLVPSLTEARARFQSYGYTVFGWSARDPLWREFFLAPKQALGCVIQIAEAGNLTPDMQWTTSSAALSQTHLTPVVKRHIAKMNAGEERWEAAPKPERRSATKASQIRANAASASTSSTSAEEHTAPAFAADVASPSHASSSSPALPPRLSLLGLRLRCASEHKARRQWGDMLQASSCGVSVDPRTGLRTLCFRWHNAPMYIAVDIERPPTGWKAERAAAAAAATSPGRPAAVDERDAAQWDGPKWLEFHAPDDAGVARIPSEAALNEMGLELCTPEETDSPNLQPQQPPRRQSKPQRVASPSRAPSTSSARLPTASAVSPSSPASESIFSPTYRALPLDPRVLRSAFVAISQPLPLPLPAHDAHHHADAAPSHTLRPISAKEIQSKL